MFAGRGLRSLVLTLLTAGLVGLAAPSGARAEEPAATAQPPHSFALTLQAGVPLRVALLDRVALKRVGEPVRARLLDTVYIFDRAVLPAGSEVDGRVADIQPVSRRKRTDAILAGDFTPLRTARLEFDTVVLKDGWRLPLDTVVSPGASQVVHLATDSGSSAGKKNAISGAIGRAREQVKETERGAFHAVTAPGKAERLKAFVLAQLPYHSQALPAGTRFNAELRAPVNLGSEDFPAAELAQLGSAIPPGSVVEARLVTPLSSATNHRGSPVEAVISQPLFSPGHHLILPEGARLQGSVTQAKPAARLARNGKLRFVFERVDLPPGLAAASQTRQIEGTLEGAEVDRTSHMNLDAEGGAHVAPSKNRYVMPAIAVLLATSAPDMDNGKHDVASRTGGDPGAGAVRGGFSFGLVGSVAAAAAHSRVVTSAFAFYGAAWSVYSHLMARGQDVTFPKDTPMEIRFGTHQEPSEPAAALGPKPKTSIAPGSRPTQSSHTL